jgi:hypothetical protein
VGHLRSPDTHAHRRDNARGESAIPG